MTTELFSAVTGSFGDIQTWALSALNVVLPIAINILGIFLIWYFGKKLFLQLSGAVSERMRIKNEMSDWYDSEMDKYPDHEIDDDDDWD